MRAGTLDRRIVIQRKSTTYSSSGTPVETWSTLATRWASVKPVAGDERNAAEQWIASEQTQFTVRWSNDISNVSPLDEVIFPAADASNSPVPSRSIYDVMAVHEPERHVYLTIMAARRVG